MKTKSKATIWLAALCLLLSGLAADARPAPSQTPSQTPSQSPNKTWTGTLVDATCYFDNPADTGNTHEGMENCGAACLRLGRPAGILTPDKKFSILIAPSPDIAKYAGQTIRVTGRMNAGMILVEKFEVQQGREWQAVHLSSIM